jgi:DNA-directed RNA polymerase specialized sigma24 family protein
VGTVVDDAASVEFHAFFERHHAELARFAHLLTGEADAADDLAADALLALWHRWDRVRAADHPVAYARGVVANLARTRIRSAVRERRRITLFWSQREDKTENPDIAGKIDVQDAHVSCFGTLSTSRRRTRRSPSVFPWVRLSPRRRRAWPN